MVLIRCLDNQHQSGTIMFNKCNVTARNRLGLIKWIQLIINVVVFTVVLLSTAMCVATSIKPCIVNWGIVERTKMPKLRNGSKRGFEL